MSKEEVVAMIGDGPCVVKTLTRHHLYCEPPVEQPLPQHHALQEAPDALPEFTVSGQDLGRTGHRDVWGSDSQVASHTGTDGEPTLLPGSCTVRWREPCGFSCGGPSGLGRGHVSPGPGCHHHCPHIQVGVANYGR